MSPGVNAANTTYSFFSTIPWSVFQDVDVVKGTPITTKDIKSEDCKKQLKTEKKIKFYLSKLMTYTCRFTKSQQSTYSKYITR